MSEVLINELHRIAVMGRRDFKGLSAMGLKLMEEVGELAEHINHREGYLPHKTMKEDLVGEVADVIQNAFCILAKAYPDLPPDQLVEFFATNLQKKDDKWASVFVGEPPAPKKKRTLTIEQDVQAFLDTFGIRMVRFSRTSGEFGATIYKIFLHMNDMMNINEPDILLRELAEHMEMDTDWSTRDANAIVMKERP